MTERDELYRRHGYDVSRNIAFVLSKALPLEGRILEIGTGKGRFLAALLRQAPWVTTIDLDPDEQHIARLNVAQAHPPGRARFVIADARDLPWRARSFDTVVSMNALHHMAQIPRVISEILRVVRPGGKVVLADFNERGFSIFDQIHRRERRIHQRIKYDIKDVARMFKAQNWYVRRCHADCQDVLVARSRM